MSSNGANLLVTRSAKEEESKKEERQQVLCVADKQTDSLCVDEERWSRGESSDCPGVNCSQLSVGFRFDCDCDDERWSRGESLCDNERWSRGESSVCPGVNSVGVCSDCDHRRTTNSVMEHERTKPTACGTSSNISKDATLFPVTHRLLNKSKTCVMHVKKRGNLRDKLMLFQERQVEKRQSRVAHLPLDYSQPLKYVLRTWFVSGAVAQYVLFVQKHWHASSTPSKTRMVLRTPRPFTNF
jgi:hypothetical protein